MAAHLQDRPPREAAPGKQWIRVPVVVDGHDTYEWREVDDVEGPQWPERGTTRLVNTALRRVDAPDKVAGRARFTHDVRLPGMLYARVLCCPYARARVALDLEPARVLEGVRDVRSLIGPEGTGETRFLGQPVAAVAARTPELAEDALHAIAARFEPLPFVVTREQALVEGAPQVTRNGNVRAENDRGDEDEVFAALDGCDVVVEGSYSVPVQHHVCMETHGLVVDYRGGDEATVYATTQGTFAVHGAVPRPLGLESGNVVVLVPHMGGGFGSKFGPGVEGQTACEMARDLKAPIHMLLTREAEFLMAGNRSGAVQTFIGGANKDGRLVALHARVDKLGGIGRGSHPGQPYVYAPQKSFLAMRAVHTHTDGSVAFRAPGHPQASFGIESFMDEMAYAVGIDPLSFRKRNLPDDAREAYERQLDRAAAEIGWADHAHKTSWDTSEGALKTGIGFGVSTWGGGGGPTCQVDVRIDRSGGVSVMCGTQDLGTGTRTFMAAIVAEELGLEPSQVTTRIGDSRLGNANASGGSTTAPSLAPAVKDAAFKARQAFLVAVAGELGSAAGELALSGGELVDAGGGRRLAWRDACQLLGPGGVEARGEWVQGLSSSGTQGAQGAKVQIDTLTGEVKVLKMVCVQNCGLPLNRTGAESQIRGAMIMALSYGLFEERVIDPALGQMLNANLVDYKIAGCQEMPELVAILDDGDTRNAVVGIGEPPVIPGHGAIANAVFNACGVRVREMPITCDKVLLGLEALRAGEEGPMKAFDHLAPATLEQALELLPSGRDPRARERTRLVAGGQDLYTELKDRLIAPDELVDLKRLPGLDGVEISAAREVTLGALAKLARLEEHLRLGLLHPLLKQAAASVASPQIRNVATLGGNLCQRPRCWYYRHSAIPCIKKGGSECLAYGGLSKYNAIFGGGPSYIVHPSDLAPPLVALGAQAEIAGKRGNRTVELERFFTLPTEGSVLRENVLEADEILTHVRVPAPVGQGWRSTYLKFRERGSYDFALASVALCLRKEGDEIAEARLVLGGVAPIPWRCASTEQLLVGRKIDAATCTAAGEEALQGARPLEHNRYKLPLTKGLITKALQKLASA